MNEQQPPFSRLLLVFARAPFAGRCKTRLIPRYGARGAAAIHRKLIVKTLRTASRVNASTQLHCEPDSRHGFFAACRRRQALTLHRQCPGDLGRKMARALRQGLRTAHAVVIIGTDCPALHTADIEQAFATLEHGADVVIKPALDGGYVLIGARCLPGSALRGIRWSSGHELRQTLHQLRLRGLHVKLLTPSWDVDHPRDVIRARLERLL
jgi:rSAM/selenodomain-associated transferase 1